ncbi:MAG: acyltransferase [Bacteroidota bacterium]|nr:acyltransferase [Bacteroidota bacterium]
MYYPKTSTSELYQHTIHRTDSRHTWVDYAKGVAIILVLYRHVFEGIKNSGIDVSKYIYLEEWNIIFFSFRMPLFFIVSGVFVSSSFAKRGFKEFVQTKMRTILYPYFLWGIIQITLQLLFSQYVNGSVDLHSYLDLLYLPREIEQFWYLYALFNGTILYVILKYKAGLRPWHHLVLGLILFSISAYLYQKNIVIGFVSDIFHYYIFIALGDVISKFIRNRNNWRTFESWKSFFLLLLPFFLSQIYFLYANIQYPQMKYQYVEYFYPFIFLPIALIGCAFVINVSFILQRYSRAKWLEVLGKHSLYIYVSHVIVVASLRILITRVFGIYSVPLLMSAGITFGLVIPVLLYKVAVKINMPWIFSLRDDKKLIVSSEQALPEKI